MCFIPVSYTHLDGEGFGAVFRRKDAVGVLEILDQKLSQVGSCLLYTSRLDDVARRAAACGGQQDDEGKQCGAEWSHGAFF